MFAELAFFSFVQLADATHHHTYNEWHQLDHLPENRALPGVAWGDRWGRPADYAAASHANEKYRDVDYVAMYWFRAPVDEAVAAWDALGATSFQWGRGPMLPGVSRPLLGFFNPVKGYAAPTALVSPEVLPYRPMRGLHLTLTRHANPHGTDAHAAFQHEDRELIPALLEADGVAGAWTFSFSHPQRHSTLPLETTDADAKGSLRIRLMYLDEDPLEVTPNLTAIQRALAPGAPTSETLLSTPVKTIIPWQDW